ncbi:type II CAAX endopeptidase family protein [Halorarius litoreus]|uniref:type II CAAX endopeptidase family protein n=1 Tax=Halorarius litoreus TaxID=2962676 RepID=UPI0020CD36F9|nr:type II CAAX endopeptidase family protein [Halorarius litoreus]
MTTRADHLAGWRGIAVFLALTFGFSWAVWLPAALEAQGVVGSAPTLPNVGAFGPTVAAFVLAAYAGGVGGAVRLAKRAVTLDYPKRWLLVAVGLPLVVVGSGLAVAVATDTRPSFPWAGNPGLLPLAYVFVFLLGGPVQEEFGWRGYLLDALQDRGGATVAGVVVGLVWALWHVPLFFIPSETIYYESSFVGFAVSITLLSVLMTWVYNNTGGSLLPMLLMHATWNWAQGMFPVLESDPGSLAFVLVQAALVVVVVAYWGPSRLRRTPPASETPLS